VGEKVFFYRVFFRNNGCRLCYSLIYIDVWILCIDICIDIIGHSRAPVVISGNATSCFAMPVIAVNTKRYLNQRLTVSSLLKHEHAVGMKLFEKRSVLNLGTNRLWQVLKSYVWKFLRGTKAFSL
jgi:hypothetical protein